MGNLLLGYYAIMQALQATPADYRHFDIAAKAIGVAVLFDGLDGRIARMTNTTSEFGRELDSLADAVTFGVAPALLAWLWGFRLLPVADSELLQFVLRFGLITTFMFLAAGVTRLARFNIQLNPQPSNPGRSGRKYFVGMPIPAGAAIIAAVVHLSLGAPLGGSGDSETWLVALWLGLILVTSFLMVSTWRFNSFKDLNLQGWHGFAIVVLVAACVVATYFYSQYTLFLLALSYMLSGVVTRLRYAIRRTNPVPPSAYTHAPSLH